MNNTYIFNIEHSLVCVNITLTYFAYICSSKGKLCTFRSSLPWKVPSLIHLFVGYLQNIKNMFFKNYKPHIERFHHIFKIQFFFLSRWTCWLNSLIHKYIHLINTLSFPTKLTGFSLRGKNALKNHSITKR